MIGDWADSTGTATPLLDRATEVYKKCVEMGWATTRTSPSWSMSSMRMPRKKIMIQKDTRQMIRVKKIAHATYETPDLDQQVGVLHRHSRPQPRRQGQGRRLPRLDRRSSFGRAAQRRRGAMRATRLPDRAGRRSRRVREADRGARHQDPPAEGSRADHRRHGRVRRPEGHADGGVQASRAAEPEIPQQGHRAAQDRPRRVSLRRRQARHQVLSGRAGISANPTGWATSSRSCAAASTITPSI